MRADAVISPDPDGALAAKVNANVRENDRPGEERVTVTREPVGVFAWPASEGH